MQDSLNLRVDSKGRINIGSLLKGFNLSSVKAIFDKESKNIILIPQVELSLNEAIKIVPIESAWFYNDKKIMKSIKKGLGEMKKNEVTPYKEILKYTENVE